MTRLLTLERLAALRDGEADLQVGPHPAGLKTGRSIHTVQCRHVFLISALLVSVALVHAQSTTIAGTWQGETANGAELVLELAVKGTALTGTFTRNGQSSPIADGKVSKNTLAFTVKIGDQTEALTGEIAGDAIELWLDRQGRTNAVVLKRAKK
jgi:hypothetical protein